MPRVKRETNNRTRLAIATELFLTANNIRQKQLAKDIQTSESTLTRFLHGENTPEAETILRLIQWLMVKEN